MKIFAKALLSGIVLAVVGLGLIHSRTMQNLEEEHGLALLFGMRGARPPPAKAVIVNLDNTSTVRLGASADSGRWPRTLHAALVDRLMQYGARVIVFDVFFAEAREGDEDHVFAEAMRRAGNVVLVEDLQQSSLLPDGGKNVEVELLVPPVEMLADAALAYAPFPLPKVPTRVSQTWRFKTSCGETPTLPAVVFQVSTIDRYEQLVASMRQVLPSSVGILPSTAVQAVTSPGLVETMKRMRKAFLGHEGLRERLEENIRDSVKLTDEVRRELVALIDMYGGPESVAIDYYGPPGTFSVLSLDDLMSPHQAMAGAVAEKIRGKVVFVGAAEGVWAHRKNGFLTVFSQIDGRDVSAVEMAATVFANLAENRKIHRFSPFAEKMLVVASAFFACAICFVFSPLVAIGLLSACNALYLFAAYMLFATHGLWLPLLTPLFVLPLAAFFLTLVVKYLATCRERQRFHSALRLYVPENVVDEISRDITFIATAERKIHSVCVMTDARHYTALSERMAPEDLSRHMKEYYRCLFREVKDAGGLVCNVIGDSMLALWPSPAADKDLCQRACRASMQIAGAVSGFNHKYGDMALPTRIGIHAGFLLMDNIGAEDHFEYAPVGDIVNTTSRIEALNKHLGTQILVSQEVVGGTCGLLWREIGCFLLSGKSNPVTVYELLGDEKPTGAQNALLQVFAEALHFFRDGEWEKALTRFSYCLALHSADGPSRFYLHLCQSYLRAPPGVEWQGMIRIGK